MVTTGKLLYDWIWSFATGTYKSLWAVIILLGKKHTRLVIRFDASIALTLTNLWQIQQTKNWWYFSIIPIKHDLAFLANCLHWRQFARNTKSCFVGKVRKIFQNVVCWIFYPACKVLTVSINLHYSDVWYVTVAGKTMWTRHNWSRSLSNVSWFQSLLKLCWMKSI